MARQYDVVILGGGNAGLGAARVAREAGRSVAVVESREVGGTCPLRGCVPKKVLVAAAETLDTINNAGVHHIEVGRPKVDWPKLIAREQSFTEGKPAAFERSLQSRGIDLYRGRARFLDRRRVGVDDEVLEAGKVVIATGSAPRALPISGAEHMITSDDILRLTELPQSMVFVGGGVIALEFAHVFARAGTKVTILEVTGRLLPKMEADAVAELQRATEKVGIEVLTNVQVRRIAPAGERLEVEFEHGGDTRAVVADRVANGAGRVADVEGLELDAGGIEHDGAVIAHTEHLRSVSNPDVYVAGDAVADSAQLSPLATYEGRLVGENLLHGDTRTPEYLPVPSVVFTVPSLASVGHTEATAAEAGLDYEVHANDIRDWLSAQLYGSEVAYAKVLVEKGGGRILGAHLVGKRAEELIHLFAFAMRLGVGAAELRASVYVFPTFSSEVASMV